MNKNFLHLFFSLLFCSSLNQASQAALQAKEAAKPDVKMRAELPLNAQWTSEHQKLKDLIKVNLTEFDVIEATKIAQCLKRKGTHKVKDPKDQIILLEHARVVNNNPYYDTDDVKPEREFASDWEQLIKALAYEPQVFNEKPTNPFIFGFKSISKDQNGRELGWLKVPDFKDDAVYVRLNKHATGFSVQYMAEKHGALTNHKALYDVPGLFYWQSTQHVQRNPKSAIITGDDSHYKSGCENAGWYTSPGEAVELHDVAKIYEQLPLLQKSFGGPFRVYLNKHVPPIFVDINKVEQHFQKTYPNICDFTTIEYHQTKDADRTFVLNLLNKESIELIHEWLNDKVKDSDLDPALKKEIFDQYIFEAVMRSIKNNSVIDLRNILIEIEDLDYCSSQQRKEFKEYIDTNPIRKQQLTAIGWLTCHQGLLQQD